MIGFTTIVSQCRYRSELRREDKRSEASSKRICYDKAMYPVLLTVAGVPISSFGLFMALAFLMSLITVWRVARSYDINEEKILDLAMLTFFGALIGARLYFVLLNTSIFDDVLKVVLINRYPGLSFWGGLLGGMMTLWLFSNRLKVDFWKIADFAAVGALVGLILGDLGCFFGGCEYGIPSDFFLATPVVGLVGKRFPVALLEAVLLLFVFSSLWKQAIKFHFSGKIAALFLIFLGVVKFFLEFYRGDARQVIGVVSLGHLFSVMSVALGLVIFYAQSKRSWQKDLRYLVTLPVRPSEQKVVLLSSKKQWYNQRVSWTVRLEKGFRRFKKMPFQLKRRLNVRSTPDNLS